MNRLSWLLVTLAYGQSCLSSDRVCMDEYQWNFNQLYKVYFPINQIPIPAELSTMKISLIAGDLAINPPRDPCRIPDILYSAETTSLTRENDFMYSCLVQFPDEPRITEKANETNKFYLQLDTNLGQCLIGPNTAGNTNTFFSLVKDPNDTTADGAGKGNGTGSGSGDGTGKGNPNTDGNTDGSSPPSDNSEDSNNSNQLLLIIGLSIGGLLLLLFGIFAYRRYKQKQREEFIKNNASQNSFAPLVDDSGKAIFGPDRERPSLDVPRDLESAKRVPSQPRNLQMLSREDANAIGEAFKDALANPNWQVSTNSST